MSKLLQLPDITDLTPVQKNKIQGLAFEHMANMSQVCLFLGGKASGTKLALHHPNKVFIIGNEKYEPAWIIHGTRGWCILIESTLFDYLEAELLNKNPFGPNPQNIFQPLGITYDNIHSILQKHKE